MESSDAYKANGGYKKWDGGPGGGGHGRGPYGGGPRPRGPRGMSDLQSDHSKGNFLSQLKSNYLNLEMITLILIDSLYNRSFLCM